MPVDGGAAPAGTAGRALRLARKKARLSLQELARRGGTSAAAISQYESGKKEPRISTLERLIDVTGSTLLLAPIPADSDADLDIKDRYLLFAHRTIAAKLLDNPDIILRKARQRLNWAKRNHLRKFGRQRLETWDWLLDAPITLIAAVIQSPNKKAAELREATPFVYALNPAEKARLKVRFKEMNPNEPVPISCV